MTGATVRERNRPLRVVVSADERAAIEARAAQTGMSVSAFLRTLGLGYEPRSTLDLAAIKTLSHVAGDQGRLGGLLKLWLSEKAGEGAREIDVSRVLRDIEALVPQLRAAAARL